mmetsp:Transcript_36730/g.115528  ORF Transcript_36730/g.115528 Transcript_36730/m.115528 type:complete len:168 (-) Transcript_36730:230-733(-)
MLAAVSLTVLLTCSWITPLPRPADPQQRHQRVCCCNSAEDGAPGDGSQPDGRRDGQRTSGNDPKTPVPGIGERLDELLDRPFFDPEERGEDEPGLLRRFRAAFDSDPESASTLFVGLYFAVLLAFAQQGVRLWKHCYAMPDSLCPWDVGLPGGDAYTAKAFSDLMNF